MTQPKSKSSAAQSLRAKLTSILAPKRDVITQTVQNQAGAVAQEAGTATSPDMVLLAVTASIKTSPDVVLNHVAAAVAQAGGGGAAAGGLPAQLVKERDEILQVAAMNSAALTVQKGLLDALKEAAEKIQDHEHIKFTPSLLSAKAAALSLWSTKGTLDTEIKTYDAWTAKLRAAQDEAQLRAVLAEHKAVQAKFMNVVTKVSTSMTDTARKITGTSVDAAIAAINFNADPTTIEKILSIADKVSELGLTVASDVPEPYTKAAASAISLVKPWLVTLGQAIYRKVMVEQFKTEHGKAAVFAKLKPLDLANKLVSDQKALVSGVLTAAGPGLGFIPGWNIIIKPAVLIAVNGFFDARIALAQKWIDAGGPQATGDVFKSLNATMFSTGIDISGWTDTVVGEFKGRVGEIADELKKVPAALATLPEDAVAKLREMAKDPLTAVDEGLDLTMFAMSSVSEWLAPAITKVVQKIFEKLPLTPAAEMYSGAALSSEIQGVYLAGRTITQLGADGATKGDFERPTKTKEGHQILTLLSSALEDDGSGRKFLWARIYTDARLTGGNREEQEGKIFHPDWEFEGDAPPAGLAALPTRTDKGRMIHEFRDAKPGADKMQGRVDNLWGDLVKHQDDNGKDVYRFVPTRPHTGASDAPAESQERWGKRTVDASGYTEGGAHVAGKWYRPFGADRSFLFIPADASGEGLWGEWVSQTIPTAGGPRGNQGEFGLQAQLGATVAAGSTPPQWSQYN
ncbi:hypothetical protein ACFWN2_03940 [Lentzea sp. NPDC058436]|uniref:hypothetical protein n=1 Tax=Lentzea sp. NPDC058436 TaxID=3346499 RepID=UPI0036479589